MQHSTINVNPVNSNLKVYIIQRHIGIDRQTKEVQSLRFCDPSVVLSIVNKKVTRIDKSETLDAIDGKAKLQTY